MRYYVHNISSGNVTFDVFNPYKGTSEHVVIERALMVDLLPYAGSLEACAAIPGLKRMSDTNLVKVFIES